MDQKLAVGDEITDQDLERLTKLSDDGKLYESAIRKLSRRPHSIFEIEQFLHKKKTDPDQVQLIIDRLVDRGYLSDVEFARYFAEQRTTFKQASVRSIRFELMKKRIDSAVIDQVVQELSLTDASVLKTTISKLQTRSKYQDRDKLIRYLQTKGFRYGDINDALTTLEDEE